MASTLNPFQADPRIAQRARWALAGLVVAALLGRLWVAFHAPWYWDEGYVADIARDLGHLQRPHSGALWANGLLPLTASWLAPLTAAPFTWFSGSQPILGIRVWAAVLGALSCGGLGLAAKRLGGTAWGLTAAALLALGPFAVNLGGLGLYHALGACLGVWAYKTALDLDDGVPGRSWAPWAWAGLAAASCYWLWWLPVGLVLRARERGWREWGLALGLGFGLPAFALGLALASPGGSSMLKSLSGYHVGLQPLSVYADCVRAFPFAWVGLLGLFLLGRGRAWIALSACLGFADLLRQRGDLIGSPYVLLPLLPWFALGLTALIFRLGRQRRALWVGLLLLACASLQRQPDDWITHLSVSPPMVRNLRNYLRSRHCEARVVITIPNAGSALREVCRPAELAQTAAWRGSSAGIIPAGLPKAAFAFDPSLDQAECLVIGRVHFDGLFFSAGLALEALRAEQAGWPLVFANPEFKVYANPVFEGRRDPQVRILKDPVFYALARRDALVLGLPQLARFAQRRSAGHKAPI